MKQYPIFLIILFLCVKAYSQTDTLFESKTFFLDQKETLNEQLKDFEGKLVYIDAWATYCSPCIKWLKKKKDYQDYFENNEIVVLCICFDKSEKKNNWKELIKKYAITGNHLFIERDSIDNYLENFNVSRKKSLGRGFPRFLIIDKEGNVAESSAYAPSRMLLTQMKKYLDK